MPSFILDKAVPFESPVDKLNSLTLDDHLSYVLLHEGVRIQGKIALVGEGGYEERRLPFCEELEVDIFLPNDVISDLRNLQVRITDYTYTLGDGSIIFHITCNIEGEEFAEEKFAFECESKEPFKYITEPPIDLSFNEKKKVFTREDLMRYENIIKENGGEIISTLDEGEEEEKEENGNIAPEIEEIIDESNEERVEEIEEIDDVKNEEEEIQPEIMIVKEENFLVTPEVDVFTVPTQSKSPNTKLDVMHSRLGIKETFTVSFSFYRVCPHDNYLGIAQKFNVDAKKLIDHNKNKELAVGVLLEIPHEKAN